MEKQSAANQIPDKEIILKGAANHLVKFEGVGGKLLLKKDELIFQAHKFNVQKHEFRIKVSDIKEFSTPFLLPTALNITDIKGKKEKFIVYGRKKWIEKITELKNGK